MLKKKQRVSLDSKKRTRSVPEEKRIKEGDSVLVKFTNSKLSATRKRKYSAVVVRREKNGRVNVKFGEEGGPKGEENGTESYYMLSNLKKRVEEIIEFEETIISNTSVKMSL